MKGMVRWSGNGRCSYIQGRGGQLCELLVRGEGRGRGEVSCMNC